MTAGVHSSHTDRGLAPGASAESDWGNLGLAAIPLVILLAVVAYVYRTARRRRAA